MSSPTVLFCSDTFWDDHGGAIAAVDPTIEQIWALADAALRGGQPFFRVHVFPFRMTDENTVGRRGGHWLDFWRNLTEGYDWFERERRPPNVTVREKRYVFGHGM